MIVCAGRLRENYGSHIMLLQSVEPMHLSPSSLRLHCTMLAFCSFATAAENTVAVPPPLASLVRAWSWKKLSSTFIIVYSPSPLNV